MKNLSIILIAFIAMASSFSLNAQNRGSDLHLQLFNKAPFTLILDGKRYQDIRNDYTVRSIPPGAHRIKVQVPQGPDTRRMRTIFKGMVEIPANREVFAYIDHRGRYIMHQSINIAAQGDDDNPYIRNTPRPERPRPNANGSTTTRPNNNNSRPQNQGGGSITESYTNSNSGKNGIATSNFEQLKTTIKESQFDEERIKVAQKAVAENGVSSNQMRQLLPLFSFDDSRLTLAKFAYKYTVDKENYLQLKQELKFDKNAKELEAFISESK